MFCIIRGFAAETSTNATVLTITAFTIERYVAICHPFLSHAESNLSRAFKYILIIWMVALTLAFPQVSVSFFNNLLNYNLNYKFLYVIAYKLYYIYTVRKYRNGLLSSQIHALYV